MSKIRSRRSPLSAYAWLLIGLLIPALAWSQEQRHWVGGNGAWNDAAHWSLTANGPGGAGVPRSGDAVTIAPVSGPVVVTVSKDAAAGDLLVDGTRASVALEGSQGRMRIGGDLELRGSVAWDYPGTVELVNGKPVSQLDLRGIPLKGDLLLTGGGTWSMRSDLVVNDRADVQLRSGTLVTNGNMLRAGKLALGDRDAKLMAGSSVVLLVREYAPGRNAEAVDAGTSRLLIGGTLTPWSERSEQEALRGMNVCATAVGQTPFTIDAQLMSNYNGYGVSCHGVCNGSVRVVVTGGVGPFTYSWIGGPAAAAWNNVCPGNQIVIVTDQGQGVSCATTVQVTDPPLLSVIFTGTQPPTCHGVCNGSSTVFAVGGVPGYTYSWNNGAGTGASFNQLCPGSNTLRVTDANGCMFDTTFVFPIQPIQPNLTTTDVLCANACDGTATAAPVGGTGNFTYDWGPGSPAGDGTPSITGLCAGNYTVIISDANGCDTTLQFVIDEPDPIIPNATHVDASCGGSCDGTATVAPSGGVGPYGFLWAPEPGGGQGTGAATGLCEGAYTVTIVDISTGCDTTVTITIDAPPALIPNPSSTDATCANTCDGTATVAPAGGTPAYTYLWTPAPPAGQNTATASQLCPGNWSVTITDDAGCDTTVQFVIDAPPPITPTPAQTDVSCAGECDGTATAPATGGTGTLTYDWLPGSPAGDGTASVTGLCAGTWTVTISDDNGCDTTIQFIITEPIPLTLDASQTDVTCGNSCDGTATATVGGGTPGYTYVWSPEPGSGQGTATAGGLCEGVWTVTATDAKGCEIVQAFTILPAVPLEAVFQLTPASCPGACDGAAAVVVNGGTPGYTYLWTPEPATGQGTASVTGLCDGPGTLTVTDAVGCDTTIAFTITAPALITANASITDPTCGGSCDGVIVLAPTGGNGTYTYAWTPVPANGDGTPTATGLCAGDYQVLVTSGGCDTTFTFTLTEPPALDVSLATTPATCSDDCDGTATLTGDLTGLSFVWAPAPGAGQGTATATGLCAGNYAVTVTNAAGCDSLIAFTIDAPTPIEPTLLITDASCGTDCDGSVVITTTGGTPGYNYFWAPEPGTGQGTATAGGLCPDDYTVTITDAAGCDTTVQFSITRPAGIDASGTVTPASCLNVCDASIAVTATGGLAPYTWAWTPEPGSGQGTGAVADLCPGTWTVTIGDQAGCDTTLSFTVTAPPAIEANATVTDPTCGGSCDGSIVLAATGGDGTYTYAWTPVPANGDGTATATGLCAGDYQVLVSSGGCDTTYNFTLAEPLPIDVSLAFTAATCSDDCDGTATLTGDLAGLSFSWTPEPGAGQGTATATGLCAGAYTVAVANAAGCDTLIAFTIDAPAPIVPDLQITNASCGTACDGSATVTASGGTPGYTYLWAPEPGSGQGTATASDLCPDTYSLTITDAAGCDTTVQFIISRPGGIVASGTVTPASCADVCDGAININATGGVGAYTYIWTPEPGSGQGTASAGNLCPGTWDVTIADQAGCDTTLTFVLGSPDPIDPNATQTPISCGGQCDGAIDLDPQGGTPGFTYVWTPEPPVGQGTANVSQLCAGDWSVLITDANGCDTTVTYSLAEPTPIVASADVTQSHCGTCDGAAQLHVSGGSAPYSFFWGPPLNLTTTDSLLTDLCGGVYTVTVTDASGCSVPLVVAVSDDDGEVLTMADGVTSCPDVCDGSVSVSYNCGIAPCTVEWTDLLGNSLATGTDTLDDLCAGTYLVSVTNGSGCITIDTAFVTEPDPLVANISSTPTSCVNTCDGTATIGIVGGVGPFAYTWSPTPGGGQGTPQATGLCAGSYEIFVQDLGGCDATFSVLITAPAPITVDATITDISCAGQCDGSITVNAQGGTGTLGYTWSPMPPAGQGTATASGLCPGTWSVTVADANGCDTTFSFTLMDPQPLSLSGSSTQSHCAVCDGSVTMLVTGGSGPVEIQWTDATGPVGSGPTLTGLCAGIYVANVTDAHGCTAMQTVVVPDANGEAITAVDGQTLCANSCDGMVSVSYICSDAPCTVAWFNMNGDLLLQGQDTLSGLCQGSYMVQVVNAGGCTTIDTAHVVPSQVIVPNLSTTPVSCYDLCDGVATVGPTGGNAPYTFNWVPAPAGGQGTPQATGLCPGSYQVTIADSTGCDTVVNVLITAPTPLSVSAQVEAISCSGACDGSIVLSPSGGSGFYSYVWSPMPPNGPGSNAAFNLCPGEWSVTIADLNGCDTTITYTITEPDPLSATTSSTLSTCSVCNGTASVVPGGGTAPYAITWLQNGTVLGTDSTIIDLCAGLYTVRVVDAHGCEVELPVPVSDIGGELLSTTDFMLTCPDHCDGVVSVAFNCDEPPCTTAWFDASGNDLNEAGNTLSNLCAGTYFVQVTNGLGCTSLDTAYVNAPDPIVANLSTTPVTCAGDCDGTATVGPTGGAGGYEYEWVLGSGTAQGTPHVVGLCAGSYQVTITDADGCSIIQDVLILSPPPITAMAVVVPITCNAACDGAITVMGQGGTGTLTYQWSPEPPNGQGTNAVTGLCADAWSVTITDANGCDTTFTLNLTDPPVLSVDLSHTDNVCFDDCVATASAQITGGVPPYAITWEASDGTVVDQNVVDVFGLCGDNYTLTVMDSRGCEIITPFTVGAGAPIVANLNVLGESCNGPCDGSASVAPTGGTGAGYTYLWQPGNPTGQGTDQVSDLCPGNWTVTITDNAGCDTTYAFTIAPFTPITPVATVQQVTCNGDCNGSIALATTGGVGNLTYQWMPDPGSGQGSSSISGLCPGSWTVTITDVAGCDTTITYTITEPPVLVVTVDTVIAASCNSASDGAINITVSGGMPGYDVAWTGPNGFTSTDEDISGLVPGSYDLAVTDLNNCQVTSTVVVQALNTVVADAGGDRTECSGVLITLDGSASQGAATYEWFDDQGNSMGTDAVIDVGNLPDGVYTYVLNVAAGVCTDADTIVVTVFPTPIADAGPDRSIYLQGTTVLGGSPAGPPGSTFIWLPDSLLDHGDIPNPTATLSNTTWFHLTVIGTDGCVGIDSVLVTVVPEVKAPSGFTPNGDGHNDTWILDFASLFPNMEVQVFSRWGEPLFRSVGYAVPWDGKYDGKVVPMGTYYYVIDLHDDRFPEALTGPLTVIR